MAKSSIFKEVTKEIAHHPSRQTNDINMHHDQENSTKKDEHIEIISQLHYQRFRYEGERRTGRKQREMLFLKIKLTDIPAGSKMKIFCIDANGENIPHPNGLSGKECKNGIYFHERFKKKISSETVSIPYLQITRAKSAQICKQLESRKTHLPPPFKEFADKNHKFDTKMVKLCICIELNDSTIEKKSKIIRNQAEGCKLRILRLSHVSSSARGSGNEPIDICTREDSPDIQPGDYEVYLEERDTYGNCLWQSAKFKPVEPDILYKHLILFRVPKYRYVNTVEDVEVFLILKCLSTEEMDEVKFCYKADTDTGHIQKKKRKAHTLTEKWLHSTSEYETASKSLKMSEETANQNIKEKEIEQGISEHSPADTYLKRKSPTIQKSCTEPSNTFHPTDRQNTELPTDFIEPSCISHQKDTTSPDAVHGSIETSVVSHTSDTNDSHYTISSTYSLPSMDLGELSSVDLTKSCSILVDFINDPENKSEDLPFVSKK